METLATGLPAAAPEAVGSGAALLDNLLRSAGETDRLLIAQLAGGWPPQFHPVLEERLELLRQLEGWNRALLPRLQGMLAVAAADLAELKQGRTAMAGYQASVPAPVDGPVTQNSESRELSFCSLDSPFLPNCRR
jgi:hypothetical protein